MIARFATALDGLDGDRRQLADQLLGVLTRLLETE